MKKEKNNENSKKGKLLVVGLSLLLLIIVTGATFAAWTYIFTGNTNTISTTGVSLEFLESNSNIINITNAMPLSNAEGIAQTDTFDFAITSTTTRTTNIDYTISIENLTPDTGFNSLDDNDIDLYLTDYSNNKLNTLCDDPTAEGVAYVACLPDHNLYTGRQSHDSTHEVVQDKFKLRVWLDQGVDISTWNADTKLQYKFKLVVSSIEA